MEKIYRIDLDFIAKKNPYDENDPYIEWGEVVFFLNFEDEIIQLVKVEWDFTEIVTWFFQFKNQLTYDPIPINQKFEISIAYMLSKVSLFDENEEIDDNFADIIYNYERSHKFGNVFFGLIIDPIYIGLTSEGYEISCYSKFKKYRYLVDLQEFIKKIEVQYPDFFNPTLY